MILFGCGTTPPPIADPEVPDRDKPLEAMTFCGPLPQLPADLPQMDTEAALKEVIRTKVKGDEIYWACLLRQTDLVRWINEE